MDYQKIIIYSGKTIYDYETVTYRSLYIPDQILESMLNNGLVVLNLTGFCLYGRALNL